jgi:hypothetical protein
MPRRPAALAAAATVSLALAAPAGALPVPLPTLPVVGEIVSTTTTTVDSLLPGVGGVVSDVTGTVGGVLTGATSTVTGAVDAAIGNVTSGTAGRLNPEALSALLGTLGTTPAQSGVVGGTGNTVDARSPNALFRVASRLKTVARTGKLRLRVHSDEAGIVAFSATARPGVARRTKSGRRLKVSRKPLHFPSAVLAYRQAGWLRVTISLSRRAQRALGRARDARMSLAIVTADVARNQGSSRVKKKIRR